jgi:hypothetical protein
MGDCPFANAMFILVGDQKRLCAANFGTTGAP